MKLTRPPAASTMSPTERRRSAASSFASSSGSSGIMLEGRIYGGAVATQSDCKGCRRAWNLVDGDAYINRDEDSTGSVQWYGYVFRQGNVVRNFGGFATREQVEVAILGEFEAVRWCELAT